jgi:hypothetical protein
MGKEKWDEEIGETNDCVFPYSMSGERERAHLKQVRVGIQGSKKWMKGVLKKNVSFFLNPKK